jgi:general secretion pathway protein M
MKLWIKTHRRSAVLIAISLLLPIYVFFAVLGKTLATRAGYQEQIDSIAPRIARMEGLVAKEQALRDALSGVNTVMNDFIYPSGSDAAAVSASMQAEARRILGQAGMNVSNSQVLPVRKRDVFDYVSVKVVARGELEQLDRSLAEIARFRPAIFVETFDAFPNRKRRKNVGEEQTLTVTMQLLSLRAVQ